MATHSWGTVTSNGSFVQSNGAGMVSHGMPLPTGRLAANGARPIYIASIAYSGGSGSRTPYFDVGSDMESSRYLSTSGGTFSFYVIKTGGSQANFGRQIGWGTVNFYPGGGVPSAQGALAGSMVYYQAPTQPQSFSATHSSSDQVTLNWAAPISNGDTAITGYRLQRSTTADFASPTTFELGKVLTYMDSGVVDGNSYYYRIGAKNAVTANAGNTSSQWSNISISLDIGTVGKRWDGSAEQDITAMYRWDGSAEVEITTWKRWNGSAEVDLA